MCKSIICHSERNAVKQSDRKVQMKRIVTFGLPCGNAKGVRFIRKDS
ncbi:hypothetical protein [Nostoc sp.]